MKDDLVKIIIKNKLHCVFLSPHQDDAALSCGELLSQLNGKTELTIINFFTKAHNKPYTLSAKKFLQTSGYEDANKLYEERRKEDKKALSTFKAKIIDLDLQDALFRKKKHSSFLGNILPEFSHIYPTYRWHVIKKIAKDDYAVSELKKKLKVFKNKKILVFAPYGIGGHADHKIVRQVCEELFDEYILYSDFPYNIILRTNGSKLAKGNKYELELKMDKKEKLIRGYKTQFQGLFPTNRLPKHKEIYFSNTSL